MYTCTPRLSSVKTHTYGQTWSVFRLNQLSDKPRPVCVMHDEESDNATICNHIYLITQHETHGTRTARQTNVPCTHVLCNTRTLPGFCHSAAVAAAALRAPAQPQLLLRLATIKVVCEFSKTRHLSCVCSPAVLEGFLHFNLKNSK